MKVVILAGGFGTRISEESHLKPKPMIEIGGKPILWHIMKIYSHYGLNDFVICLGYKSYLIKEYFANYFLHESDVTFDFRSDESSRVIHHHQAEPWRVTLIDTGENTMTGGRVKRIAKYLDNEPFALTYGDGVSDVNIPELLAFHRAHQKMVTVTAVQPSGKFGSLDISATGEVGHFVEKPRGDGAWINGGFFICQPEFLDCMKNDQTVLEREPLEYVAKTGDLRAYRHHGFWQPMDTMRDRAYLEELCETGKAPWKVWETA